MTPNQHLTAQRFFSVPMLIPADSEEQAKRAVSALTAMTVLVTPKELAEAAGALNALSLSIFIQCAQQGKPLQNILPLLRQKLMERLQAEATMEQLKEPLSSRT